MIETILKIAKMILAILPFFILCLASKRVNLPTVHRSKQFWMPIVALSYVIIAIILMDRINEWLIKLFNNIPKWIIALANYSWTPTQLDAALIEIGNSLKTWLNKLNLNFWIFFVANALIILVYLILKKFCIGIISKGIKTDGELHSKVAGNFYEYFPEKSIWCIKENYVQVRSMFRVFYYSAVVLSVLLMIVSRKFYFNGLIKSVFYPVFGILILGELYFYLDGATKREYAEQFLGEDEDAYRIVNYTSLRKYLRSIFRDKLLAENTSVNNTSTYDVTTDEIIRKLEKSEDQKIVNFAVYADMLNKTGFPIDHHYLHSCLDMLNGKSILFNDPFYNDLIPYAFYPMNRALLSHQKVLVVLGRHSIENDIKRWLEKGIATITNIPFMWNIGILNSEPQNLDIGIVTRSAVLDIKLHNANVNFLEKVGFFIILEPSKLITTAQIGLNLLTKKCKTDEDKNIVYCMCDKNCDGLVDTMSHILMTSITEVSATPKHFGTSSYMCWEVDNEYLHHRLVPNISRYLGIGTELSFAALKNQVSKTKWYGGEAFPVIDIHWIAKQYYYDLTKYAGLSTSQESIDEHFLISPNFWSAEIEKNNYFTVEDEAYNMFEILRDFSTRTTEQGFINVISSDYLLRDYMAENASIFEADAKAVPLIVADYTRSNRNTILRLVLMMSTFPVSEKILEKELSLLGTQVFDLKKQLWYELYSCYSELSKTTRLPDDYQSAVQAVYNETLKVGDAEWRHDIFKPEESFNLKAGEMETTYSITDPAFLSMCVSELYSAGYVAEDEKGRRYYLGSELSGHIYQKYLPGQFFTFGGKYYEMQHLTADGQILVRRASEHITGRPAYRQIREYTIHGVKLSEKIGAQQDIAGLKVIKEFADISVRTFGYYRMERYNDFTTAKRVLFEGEKNGIPNRAYHNKEILQIELPDFDGKLNDNIRYTITVLLNEIFKTLFAENQAYICAVTDDVFLAETESGKPFTYSVKGDNYQLHNNAVYIIEDSQLDLGLTVAVERNLQRVFNMVYDYLDWHLETLETSLAPPLEPRPPIVFTTEPKNEEKPKTRKGKRIFSAIGRHIKRTIETIKVKFHKKPKKGDEPSEEVPLTEDEVPADDPSVTEKGPEANNAIPEKTISETENDAKVKEKPKKKNILGRFKRKKQDKMPKRPDSKDIPNDEKEPIISTSFSVEVADTESEKPAGGETPKETDEIAKEPAETTETPSKDELIRSPKNEHTAKVEFSVKRKPYHERYYMLYGRDSEFPFIDLTGTFDYLAKMRMQCNSLKQAREGKRIADLVEATFKPGKPNARYCDFCGTEIFGVEYETLADGRDRCLNCGRTAIKTSEEFRKVFEDVKRNFESFFGVKINAGIKVEMVNSKKLHKHLGKTFIATPQFDPRVLGVAIHDKGGYTLMMENSSPRMASMLTMAHELTHIWQYINWNDKSIRKKYGKKLRLEIYEGMAKWVEIQYAYLINEPAIAKREEIITSYREDEYGRGFLRYRANYPFSLGTVVTKTTPFMNVATPLAPEFCSPFVFIAPMSATAPEDAGDEILPPDGVSTIPVDLTGPVNGLIERNPDTLNKYAYNLLDNNEKAVYEMVLKAIESFSAELDELVAEVTDAQLQKIIDYIQRDHPEIFWFQHGATFSFDPATHIVNRLELKYCMTQDEAKKRQGKIDAVVKSFLLSIQDSMSDYEVTLRLYEDIIKLVDYDTIGPERRKRTESSPEIPDDLRSIYGALVNKKAVCAGYAKAMQYVLNVCGIECTYVNSDTHAWNLVKLEGDYYHLDAAWGDFTDTKNNDVPNDAVKYDCFCITSEELSRLELHAPKSDFPLPECTATKCNYHRRHGSYFDKYDYNKVRAIVCESIRLNKLEVSFKFGSLKVYSEAKTHLVNDGKFREAIQLSNLKSKFKINLSYSYAARDDLLTLAFYMTKV